MRCCPGGQIFLLVSEFPILLSSSGFLAYAVRYVQFLCVGLRVPAFDLDFGAIDLNLMVHVLYWSVGESHQWSLCGRTGY